MNLELILVLVVGFGVPLGALGFFEWLSRKEIRELKPSFGRFS
jgi:hypothetical protein